MRSILLLLTFLATYTAQAALSPSADTTRPRYVPTRTDIQQDVRRLNTSGAVLAVGGAGMLTTGIFLLDNAAKHDEWDTPNSNIIGGVILLIAGTFCLLATIPLFIVAGHKKRKYLRGDVSFGTEKIDGIQMPRVTQTSFPAIGFKLRF
jgi:hypothetical protein